MAARVVLIGKDSDRLFALGRAFTELGAGKVSYVESPLHATSQLTADEDPIAFLLMPGTRQLVLQRLLLEHQRQSSRARLFMLVSGTPDVPSGVTPIEDVPEVQSIAERLWRELRLALPRFDQGTLVSSFWRCTVSRAWDRQRARTVLLARLPMLEGGQDGELVADWLEEVRRAQAVQHRNLPPLLEAGHLEDECFQLWEDLTGVPLKDRIYPRFMKGLRPLSVESCIWVATQVTEALAEIHRAGLRHYLLDPATVWVLPDGGVRLMYLGFGREAIQTRRSIGGYVSSVVPSMADMAPEELDPSHPRSDARTDVYRLGLLLYEMLFKHHPFYQRNDPLAEMKAIREKVLEPPMESRPEMPAGLVSLMLRMLEKNPDRRPANAAEALEALKPLRARSALFRAPEELGQWSQEFLRTRGGEDSAGGGGSGESGA
ncbi:protein kinase domain-containing protein [Hyalangium versicolor]|uniref:protein kinase domain-containing protein n=1 Tax=Hyalangium versicolor TaxID=2861190 RepID=UPI001CCEB905|nr:protein kinase [Hyalangium versicolor]